MGEGMGDEREGLGRGCCLGGWREWVGGSVGMSLVGWGRMAMYYR